MLYTVLFIYALVGDDLYSYNTRRRVEIIEDWWNLPWWKKYPSLAVFLICDFIWTILVAMFVCLFVAPALLGMWIFTKLKKLWTEIEYQGDYDVLF